EDAKHEDKASAIKLYIKDKLQNHILTKSELNLKDIEEQIRTLKIIYKNKKTGPFYENLVKLFTEQKPTKLTCHPMLAGGIGDALGRVTEFIKSTKGIFNKYTNGVLTYDDFQPNDWNNIPEALQKNRIAPY